MSKIKKEFGSLTGNVIHRTRGYLERIYLQVEIHCEITYPGLFRESGTTYRYATPEDMIALSFMPHKPLDGLLKNLDKEDEFLTGKGRWKSTLFTRRMYLQVEEYDCLLTKYKTDWYNAKPHHIESGLRC